jgi:hypothetical protein
MEALSSAAVGSHGRVSSWPAAGCAALFLTTAATVFAQPLSFQDLAPALAAKIASAVAGGERIAITSAVVDAADEAPVRQVQREVARLLSARGLRIDALAAAQIVIVVGCATNLRERVCVAEIRRGPFDSAQGRLAGDFVSAVAPRGFPADPAAVVTLALETVPIFSQRTAILDVAPIGDRLVVLDPSAVTLYQHADEGWRRVASRPVVSSQTWPRDIRGRLRTNGAAVEAFLPGVVCRASVELTNLVCANERESWPLAVDNSGIDAARNYFQTPEGLAFVNAASLGADAEAAWVLADGAGRLVLLDADRKPLGGAGAGDDVAGISARCQPGSYIVTSSSTAGADTDTLSLWQVVGRRLMAVATPIVLPGRLTALWAAPGASVATAVTHDAGAGRYEAFHVNISCVR